MTGRRFEDAVFIAPYNSHQAVLLGGWNEEACVLHPERLEYPAFEKGVQGLFR